MTGSLDGALFATLFLAGLAGSLHCLAMCGPLLIAFDGARGSAPGGRRPRAETRTVSGRVVAAFSYHFGRIWTYGLLGFLAGWGGAQAGLGATILEWQRPVAIIASALVLIAGFATLGWVPGLRLGVSLPGGCLGAQSRWRWLASLAGSRRAVARFLLGAVMGLLPCGLVYAMLLVAATLPSPFHSALGMALFGAGTLPALTALMVSSGALPSWLRARSPRLAGVVLVAGGLLMLARSLLVQSY